MPNPPQILYSEQYPNNSRWLSELGTIEIGYYPHTRSFIRVINEGGMIWCGKAKYKTLEAALADCDKYIGQWFHTELGERPSKSKFGKR